ncbi:MAG: hypothetical protein CL420_00470 [Acidimicrobiaceae bacterium]|nr:hypothetical protein [Acidimicrobiaceae bacterium]
MPVAAALLWPLTIELQQLHTFQQKKIPELVRSATLALKHVYINLLALISANFSNIQIQEIINK